VRRGLRVIFAFGMASALVGCGGISDKLGLEKRAPDEFAVVRNAPLSLPPDFHLRPPKPGEEGADREEQRARARSLLVQGGGARSRAGAQAALASAPRPQRAPEFTFVAGRTDQQIGSVGEYGFGLSGGRSVSPGGSGGGSVSDPGERALLARLDAEDVDPTIRRTVDREAKVLAADDRNFVERMMFWRSLNPPGVIVEPTGESRRIQENAALGRSVTEGETPKIEVERLSSGFSGIKLF